MERGLRMGMRGIEIKYEKGKMDKRRWSLKEIELKVVKDRNGIVIKIEKERLEIIVEGNEGKIVFLDSIDKGRGKWMRLRNEYWIEIDEIKKKLKKKFERKRLVEEIEDERNIGVERI